MVSGIVSCIMKDIDCREKMISILVDPAADPSTLVSPLVSFSLPSLLRRFSQLGSAVSIGRRLSCERILQCGITMATAMVSDIYNAQSSTVDP